MTYTLEDIEGETKPEWVSMNAPESITLTQTPIVSEITQYKFGLQTAFSSETYTKNFYIMVEP